MHSNPKTGTAHNAHLRGSHELRILSAEKDNSYFVYARRAKKKRIYDHALTGEFDKWIFTCRIVNLKDSIVETMY